MSAEEMGNLTPFCRDLSRQIDASFHRPRPATLVWWRISQYLENISYDIVYLVLFQSETHRVSLHSTRHQFPWMDGPHNLAKRDACEPAFHWGHLGVRQ